MQLIQDETIEMIRGEVRSLVRNRAGAMAIRWNEGHGRASDLLPTLAEMGLLGVLVAEANGGAGLDAAAFSALLNELAVADAGAAALVAQHNIALRWAEVHGFAANAGKALTQAARGAALLCLIDGRASGHLDDPAPGVVLRDGALHGEARSVLGGGDAAYAMVVAGPVSNLQVTLVDLAAAGVQRSASQTLVGLQSAGSADLMFAGATPLASAPAQGLEALRALPRLAMAALLTGTARAAHEAGVRYTLERVQFGKPIAHFQPMQWQTADSTTELAGADLLLARAAWAMAGGQAPALAADAVDRAVVAAYETARRVTDRALQMHGGAGYTTDYAVERPYRDVHALPLLGGSAMAARARIGSRLAAAA